jgi:hypothetical protein
MNLEGNSRRAAALSASTKTRRKHNEGSRSFFELHDRTESPVDLELGRSGLVGIHTGSVLRDEQLVPEIGIKTEATVHVGSPGEICRGISQDTFKSQIVVVTEMHQETQFHTS